MAGNNLFLWKSDNHSLTFINILYWLDSQSDPQEVNFFKSRVVIYLPNDEITYLVWFIPKACQKLVGKEGEMPLLN